MVAQDFFYYVISFSVLLFTVLIGFAIFHIALTFMELRKVLREFKTVALDFNLVTSSLVATIARLVSRSLKKIPI